MEKPTVGRNDMFTRPHYSSKYATYVENLPAPFNSTKGKVLTSESDYFCAGLGQSFPNPDEMFYTKDGVGIPLGQHMTTTRYHLTYNEYMVYDPKQVIMKYLVEVA